MYIYQFPSLILLLTLLVMLLTTVEVQSFTCYSCRGNLTEEKGRACAEMRGVEYTPDNRRSCFTSVEYNLGQLATIERGGVDYDVSSDCILGGARNSTSCYCATKDCNGEKVRVPSLTCYVCNTVPMINNGCSDRKNEWWSNSLYVATQNGCHACTKRKAVDGSVTRACSNSIYADKHCESDGNLGTVCYCTDNYCNSARDFSKEGILGSVIATIVLILLSVI